MILFLTPFIWKDFALSLSVLLNGSEEEKLEWTFQLYDLDGDGVISREEMLDVTLSVSFSWEKTIFGPLKIPFCAAVFISGDHTHL